MPIYEYRCNACAHSQEYLQKISDASIDICPNCGSSDYKKCVSAAGFKLKGSGWYETDFKKTQSKKDNKPSCPHSDGCSGCG